MAFLRIWAARPFQPTWRAVLALLLVAASLWTWFRPPPGPLPCEGTLVCGRPLDLNFATQDELKRIPGIGPSTAQHIARTRPFQNMNELLWVRGIGPTRMKQLRPFLAVIREPPPRPPPRRLDLNSAEPEQLERLPRVGPVLAARIVAARPYTQVDDLLRVRGIGPVTLAALRPRLQVASASLPSGDGEP